MAFFQDIFRSNLLNNLGTVTGFDMAVAVILSFGMGMFILLIHRRIYYGAMYSESFGVSLVALCMITTALILAVSSNVVLSLGMVGALSVVRFRAAVKEPMELAFLFWSMEAGLVLAAGMIPLAIGVNVAIGALLLLWAKRKRGDVMYMLVLQCESDKLDNALAHIKESVKRYQEKSDIKSATLEIGEYNEYNAELSVKAPDIVELDIEVALPKPNGKISGNGLYAETNSVLSFVRTLREMPGVRKATLVEYNGDYMEEGGRNG